MTAEFFQPGLATDPVYDHVRSCSNDILKKACAFTEVMWQACGAYVDADSPARAKRALMPVWWELYLAYALLLPAKQSQRAQVGSRNEMALIFSLRDVFGLRQSRPQMEPVKMRLRRLSPALHMTSRMKASF